MIGLLRVPRFATFSKLVGGEQAMSAPAPVEDAQAGVGREEPEDDVAEQCEQVPPDGLILRDSSTGERAAVKNRAHERWPGSGAWATTLREGSCGVYSSTGTESYSELG